MKTLPLTKGFVTIVDDADFDWLSQFKWCVSKSAYNHYAVRLQRPRKIYMHREIAKPTNGQVVHHRNGDSLDNRRANLELCDQTENLKYRKWKGKNHETST